MRSGRQGAVTEGQAVESGEQEEASQLHTFLIADIRNYTNFTEEHGDEAAARLAARFADLASDTVSTRRGQVVELHGDEVLAVFDSARDALHAGVDLQARLIDERDSDLPLEVRVGVDAGDAVPVKGGYRSGALNRAARLQSIAQPGEVLASDMVIALARKMEGLVTLDRGEAQLKGFSDPVKVFQVVAEDRVPAEVPKFSARRAPPTNLSPQQTSFVGREPETNEVVALLTSSHVRLLTLTGPGGIGKTRLAIRTAETVAESFDDGVFFVPLASARDVDSVLHSIVQALGVDESTVPNPAAMKNYIGTRQMLLVLDNFEQVIVAAPQVAELIAACPRLTVLVTSREVLRLSGEQEYRVPPMDIPDPGDPVEPAALEQYESVRLFLDRVSMRQPEFALTEENAAAVAEICRRLDGLPLAIELAAARIKVFPPPALLARLDHRLGVLTGGSRDVPSRQKTLRNAIAWSYDLLEPPEQVLFRRLAAFVGGCSVDSAEAVCGDAGDLEIDVLDGLASLVDKSLVQQHEGPGPEGYVDSRFVMLETIREFARDELAKSGELDDLQRRHAEYFLSLAEQTYDRLMSAERDPWRDLWNVEWGNVRAILQWSVEGRHPDVGLLLAGLLWVWSWLDGPVEMRDWVEKLLAMPEAEAPARARGWGLGAATLLAWQTGDLDRVLELSTVTLDTARASGDEKLIPGALAVVVSLDPSARSLVDEARERFRAQNNDFGIGFATVAGVPALLANGEAATLQRWLNECLSEFQRTGDIFGQGLILRTLGTLAVRDRALHNARRCLLEALERFRSMHERRYVPLVLLTLGGISRLLGEDDRAADEFREALDFVLRYTSGGNLASCIEGLAAVALDRGDTERAARLLGAARSLRESSRSVAFPMGEILNAGIEEAGRTSLDTDTFARLSAEGSRMEEREVVELARSVTSAEVSRA